MPAHAPARYFDYLDSCGERLAQVLGIGDLSTLVSFYRHVGSTQPRTVVCDVRRVAEQALWALMCRAGLEDGGARPNLVQKTRIQRAHRSRLISANSRHDLHEIRRLGNRAAHAGPGEELTAAEAERALKALERFLRATVVRLDISRAFQQGVAESDGISILVGQAGDLVAKARLADELQGTCDALEREARESERRLSAASRRLEEASGHYARLAETLYRVELELDEARSSAESTHARHEDEVACLRVELSEAYALLQDVVLGFQPAVGRAEDVRRRVEGVLSEHDLVAQLVGNGASATREQWRVMEFPRSLRSGATFLNISGGGGTGKTLCLVAKLIREVSREPRAGDAAAGEPRALFVCFNRDLAAYVERILEGFPAASSRIEVVSYDTFANQLVRERPKERYAHLAPYARDVRYERGWSIGYPGRRAGNTTDAVRRAMVATADANDEATRRRYRGYLDASSADDVTFMEEELTWLIERYEDVGEARERYVEELAPRTGRGGMRRPRKEARALVCDVWEAFEHELVEERRYTIGQATRRLLASQALPAYDAIAIDEAQDFSLARIRLICRMRRSPSTPTLISGDEDQRLYQRDFTWGELSAEARGHTVHLTSNMRNPASVHAFAERLHGRESTREEAGDAVTVIEASDEELVGLCRELAEREDESTVVIGRPFAQARRLRQAGLSVSTSPTPAPAPERRPAAPGGRSPIAPGLYCLGAYTVKGLEFDNVVCDLTHTRAADEASEVRLRYVHFTRARKHLYVRHAGTVPHLLKEYYADFL